MAVNILGTPFHIVSLVTLLSRYVPLTLRSSLICLHNEAFLSRQSGAFFKNLRPIWLISCISRDLFQLHASSYKHTTIEKHLIYFFKTHHINQQKWKKKFVNIRWKKNTFWDINALNLFDLCIGNSFKYCISKFCLGKSLINATNTVNKIR